MKLYVIVLKDKGTGRYHNVTFHKEDEEHVREDYILSCAHLKGEEVGFARDTAVYYLGTFDNCTCKFDLFDEPQKLVDLEDYIKIEVVDDGKKEDK